MKAQMWLAKLRKSYVIKSFLSRSKEPTIFISSYFFPTLKKYIQIYPTDIGEVVGRTLEPRLVAT
jgi:hypothetical protein